MDTNGVKPGSETSELKLTVGALFGVMIVATTLLCLGMIASADWTLIAMALPTGLGTAYTLQRGYVKGKANGADKHG